MVSEGMLVFEGVLAYAAADDEEAEHFFAHTLGLPAIESGEGVRFYALSEDWRWPSISAENLRACPRTCSSARRTSRRRASTSCAWAVRIAEDHAPCLRRRRIFRAERGRAHRVRRRPTVDARDGVRLAIFGRLCACLRRQARLHLRPGGFDRGEGKRFAGEQRANGGQRFVGRRAPSRLRGRPSCRTASCWSSARQADEARGLPCGLEPAAR